MDDEGDVKMCDSTSVDVEMDDESSVVVPAGFMRVAASVELMYDVLSIR